MQTKSLSERIAGIIKCLSGIDGSSSDCATAEEAVELIKELEDAAEYGKTLSLTRQRKIDELQTENQALLAKNGELEENYDIILETHNHFLNKPIYAHCEKLEAKVKELEGKGWQPIESAEIGKWVLVATAKIAMKAFVDTKANCGTDLIIIGDDGREYQDFVTHWMPLPELPTKIKGE